MSRKHHCIPNVIPNVFESPNSPAGDSEQSVSVRHYALLMNLLQGGLSLLWLHSLHSTPLERCLFFNYLYIIFFSVHSVQNTSAAYIHFLMHI